MKIDYSNDKEGDKYRAIGGYVEKVYLRELGVPHIPRQTAWKEGLMKRSL